MCLHQNHDIELCLCRGPGNTRSSIHLCFHGGAQEDLEGGGKMDETDQWNTGAILNAQQTVAEDSKLLFQIETSADDDASLRFYFQIQPRVAVRC